mgnify:CR=1 FL=1
MPKITGKHEMNIFLYLSMLCVNERFSMMFNIPKSDLLERITMRILALELARISEATAIAASEWVGRRDAKLADQAAVDIMRSGFNNLDINPVRKMPAYSCCFDKRI